MGVEWERLFKYLYCLSGCAGVCITKARARWPFSVTVRSSHLGWCYKAGRIHIMVIEHVPDGTRKVMDHNSH
jgi:hypothetical protein